MVTAFFSYSEFCFSSLSLHIQILQWHLSQKVSAFVGGEVLNWTGGRIWEPHHRAYLPLVCAVLFWREYLMFFY